MLGRRKRKVTVTVEIALSDQRQHQERGDNDVRYGPRSQRRRGLICQQRRRRKIFEIHGITSQVDGDQ
jgi:hypothetical protein